MEKKILCIAVIASLLTGCISNKVNHAHTTALSLSQDIDKFVLLSNTSIELNKVLALKEQEQNLSNGLSPEMNLSKTDREYNFKYQVYNSYGLMNSNKEMREAFTKQNQLLVEYFKNLPLILEDKSVDVAGLVNNIDYLNQVIEKNISPEGEVNSGLKQVPKDLITKTLSSGFKFHQYKTFKKAIEEQSPIIIDALGWQRVLFAQNSVHISSDHLNKKYTTEYNKIEQSLLSQFYVIDNLRVQGNSQIPKYNLNELKNFDQLAAQPYTYFNYLKPEDIKTEEPKIKSAAYNKLCKIDKETQMKDFSSFLEQNKANLIEIKDFNKNPPTFKYGFYDIERNYSKSGDQLACELINIVGLMQENKFDDVKLKQVEKYLSNYDDLLKYLSNLYLPKKEDK